MRSLIGEKVTASPGSSQNLAVRLDEEAQRAAPRIVDWQSAWHWITPPAP
ncbi:hypothetical protein OG883_31915 [Streptomyces sp. NBC_01142]|nr:hypothetical protein [Streptomyces sp. NBC_01142]MCX4824382.1 hypothetical protein [Streptomyces sp. NBC_01142]